MSIVLLRAHTHTHTHVIIMNACMYAWQSLWNCLFREFIGYYYHLHLFCSFISHSSDLSPLNSQIPFFLNLIITFWFYGLPLALIPLGFQLMIFLDAEFLSFYFYVNNGTFFATLLYSLRLPVLIFLRHFIDFLYPSCLILSGSWILRIIFFEDFYSIFFV